MKQYELWLDESGKFIDQIETEEVPSMVGGLLFPVDQFDSEKATQVVNEMKEQLGIEGSINGKFFHSTKYGTYAKTLLKKLYDENGKFVVFQNKERLSIINNDYTYINILAEGVIQLLRVLQGTNSEEVHLSVKAARRLNVTKSKENGINSFIHDDEFIVRLKERILLAIARTGAKNMNWDFEVINARRDIRSEIGDCICHTWFRKNSPKKFTDEHRVFIHELYHEPFLFSVFEHATSSAIMRLLGEGSVGEALFEALVCYDDLEDPHFRESATKTEVQVHPILDSVIQRFVELTDRNRDTQFSITVQNIEQLLDVDRDLQLGKTVLENLQTHGLPLIAERNIHSDFLAMKAAMLLLVCANHQGDVIAAEKQLKQLRKHLKKMQGRFEFLDLWVKMVVLEAVHEMNCFQFERAVVILSHTEKTMKEVFALVATAFQNDEAEDRMKSQLVGKLLGTRLLSRILLGRKDPNQLLWARQDSQEAISKFFYEEDKSRQYQYRSQLECEAHQFHDSLFWLGKAFHVEIHSFSQCTQLLEAIESTNYYQRLFGLMHYTRLMAELALAEQLTYAEQMLIAWDHAGIENIDGNDHPIEIIYWKLATTEMKLHQPKKAFHHYDKALKICQFNKERLTLRVISLGVEFERVALLAEQKDTRFSKEMKEKYNHRSLKKAYQNLLKEEIPSSMREFLSEWEAILELEEVDADRSLSYSRMVPY